MREYVLVEFWARAEDRFIVKVMLSALGEDFIPLEMDDNYDTWPDGEYISYAKYSGKISSEYASIIKLQNPFLAERMRISYIPNALKDRYRK